MSNSIVNINVHNHSNNTVISHASLDKSLPRSYLGLNVHFSIFLYKNPS